MDLDVERAMAVARDAAQAAGAAALRYWGGELRVERKPDRTPVTAADRDAEAAALGIITAAFPDHGILAEESGVHRPDAPARWIVDPLDGTRGFSRGGLFWGPVVALEHAGEIVAGAVAIPALGELYWAGRGLGCYRDGARLQVSGVDELAEATLSLGELSCLLVPPCAEGVARLIRDTASARAFGDIYAGTLLLSGRADVWLEAGVKLWDVAPMKVLVEEAGGRITDFAGAPSIAGGYVLATNGRLHQDVLAYLSGVS